MNSAAPTVGDCSFYHSIDLPITGSHEGVWDLRGRFDDYIGHTPLAGRTLLDVGTASGFLSFEAEKRGADVTSFDMMDATLQEELPLHDGMFVTNYPSWLALAETNLERIKNSYWLSHRELDSNAKCVYGNLYDLNREAGSFDVVLVGQVLIHLRDAIAALTAISSVCDDTLIIVEGSSDDPSPIAALSARAHLPDVAYAWYQYSHGWYREILAMLGFTKVEITTDAYKCNHAWHDDEIELATVVASRPS